MAPALLNDPDESLRVRRRIARPAARKDGSAMLLAKLVLPLCTCALIAATSGCSVAVEGPTPPVATTQAGSLTVRWLIAGAPDPVSCAEYGASELELVVYDEAGRRVATTTAPCESFSVSLALPEGSYTADVTLIDGRARSVSRTKALESIEIVAGTDIAIDLDFPLDFMLVRVR